MEEMNSFFRYNGTPEGNPISRIVYLPGGTERLEKLGQKKTIKKNTVLVKQGERPSHCFIIVSGKVAGYEYTPTGEEHTFFINEANSVLLESMILFDWNVPVNFKTLTECEIVFISKENLINAINTDPRYAMDIIKSQATKFEAAMTQMRYSVHYNTEWKICDLLIHYAEYYGVPYDGKILISEKISQQAMSNLLGVNRVTTVRAIKDLKDSGLIEQINGHYCIRDMCKLKRHKSRLE